MPEEQIITEELEYTSIYEGEEIDEAIGMVRTHAGDWDDKYELPGGGIPKTDLSPEVQASLAKADSAVQQSENLTGYATTAELQSHTNDTAAHVTQSDKNAWDGKYAKPSGGIPSSDLDLAVQAALIAADTALQPSDITEISSSVSSLVQSANDNAVNELTQLPESGTALTENRIYNIPMSSPIGNYTFIAPANGGWAHGIFKTAGSGTRSFDSGAKFIGGDKPTKANTVYEFDVIDNIWAFAEVE